MNWLAIYGLLNKKISSTKSKIDQKLEKPTNEGTFGQTIINDGEGNSMWGDVVEETMTIAVNNETLFITTN